LQHRPKKILLTFDIEGWPPVEDNFDDASAICLCTILNLLEREDFQGIFFVTGSIAEQLHQYPDILDKLSDHKIGYHSSAHNAQPGIIAITDVPSYEKAVALSLERETSHINLVNGKIEGKGGLLALKETFPSNNIECFRAPFFGWSPPHLEALRELGIKYDFSTHISNHPVLFKEIVFYPIPVPIDTVEFTLVQRIGNSVSFKTLTSIMLHRRLTILSLHPSALLVKHCFDNTRRSPRGKTMIKFTVCMLKLLFRRIHFLQRHNLVKVTASLGGDFETLDARDLNVRQIYQRSIQTPVQLFSHNPKYVLSHFMYFFNSDKINSIVPSASL